MGAGLFSDMSFLEAVSREDSRVTAGRRPAADLLQFYTQYLTKIIGDYSKKCVAFFNIANDKERQQYEDILNDPSCTILEKEGTFSADETRSRDEFYKETSYRVVLIYKKDDYDLACRKMKEHVVSLPDMRPRINHTTGLEELLKAWEIFSAGMPEGPSAESRKIAGMLTDFIETIKKEGELAVEDGDEYNKTDAAGEKPSVKKGKPKEEAEDNRVILPELSEIILREDGERDDDDEDETGEEDA